MYLHVDINAYFASLLQQETPSLRGRPLGIVKDLGRTCIIAASKEAKLKGVKTGCNANDAKVLCPDILLLPADFELYLSATQQLQRLFNSITPNIEIFSLDEAFIPYDALSRLYPDPVVLGHQIQQQIRQTLGEWVSCNVGIGPTRFLAKMIGETTAKGSVSQVTAETAPALLARVGFNDVCGIGRHLAARLAQLGVTTPYQINFIPQSILERSFGPFWSEQLQIMAKGDEPLFLQRLDQPLEHMKGIGRSITLFALEKDETVLRRILYNLTTEVMYKARWLQLAGRQVSVGLTGHQQSWDQHQTLQSYVSHTGELFSLIDGLCRARPRRFPVIRLAIHLGLLSPVAQVQPTLLPTWWRDEQVEDAMFRINNRYGLFTVRSGLLADGRRIIRPEVTGFLGDKQFQLGAT